MKSVIDGVTYNTETAEEVATTAFRESDADRYNSGKYQTLYKTSKGRFFIAYYTLWDGQQNKIEAVGTRKAKEFCRDFGDSDTVAEVFSPAPTE